MKLRNKKTGEMVDFNYLQTDYISPLLLTVSTNGGPEMFNYYSLAEINEEWEDVPEEPKLHWYIYGAEPFEVDEQNMDKDYVAELKSIGNYFENREEAEKAVEKLKAWKRLTDKGFRFDKVTGCWIEFTLKSANSDEEYEEGQKDLLLLFGGEK